MPTKPEIQDAAIEVLRRNEPLTIDSVAKEIGLTKAGIVHHFPTKDALATAVVDRVVDSWVEDLTARVPPEATGPARVRAYVDHAFNCTFDASDLALLSDLRLRVGLTRQWNERLEPWFGLDYEGTVEDRAALRAARLIADGAWINGALGITTVLDGEREAARSLALGLVDGVGAP